MAAAFWFSPASELHKMMACRSASLWWRERLRQNSSCRIRRERRSGCRPWFPEARWCSSSTAATGDPSASASWRITATIMTKSGPPALILWPCRLIRQTHPKRYGWTCGCRS